MPKKEKPKVIITIPEDIETELQCNGCNQPSLSDLLPITGSDVCNFLHLGAACNPDNWDYLSDPYNPYSIPALFNSVPGIGWDSTRVSWTSVYTDAAGLLGDLIPVAQPGAEGLEFVGFFQALGKIHSGLGLGLDEADMLDTYVLKDKEKFDWINFGLDGLSLAPWAGAAGSAVGIPYNLSKGLYTYDRPKLYGPPSH